MAADARPSTVNGQQFTVAQQLRTTLVPLALMLASPPAVQFVWVASVSYGGDARRALLDAPGSALWARFPAPTRDAAAIALGFACAQALLLAALPGDTFHAIPTPMGNRPAYKLNGVLAFALTHGALLAAHYAGLIRYGAVYDHFGPMLAFLGKFAMFFTALLYVKGIYYPTNSDSGTTGHGFVWDLWHGTELHPELFGISLKQFVNCRFAMMGWSVAVVAFALKQHELYGFLSPFSSSTSTSSLFGRADTSTASTSSMTDSAFTSSGAVAPSSRAFIRSRRSSWLSTRRSTPPPSRH
jgi:7-dehydrocholesterol reductase